MFARVLSALKPRNDVSGFWGWIATVDHKRIGILYGISAFIFFLVGGIEALIIRLQLAQPGLSVVTPDRFNELFTMHATTMIFLAVMPLSAAFMNYFLPLMIGARDVAFPRLNALSFWIFLGGAIFLNSSWLLGGAPNSGWFAYAPLSSKAYSGGPGMDFWIMGLQLVGIASLISAINFIVTILNMRAPGMTLMHMPIFVWTTLVTSFLLVFSLPAITVALFMLMFDRFFGANFFAATAGGDPVLWQQLFWVFGHPEVYILILPAMGMVSEILPVFSRKPLFGYSAIVGATGVIGFLAFIVWGHHMFAVGQGPIVNLIFSLTTMAIAVPTGVKIFNWLATLWGGQLRFTTAMLYATAFIAMFTIGGLSGVMHASGPSDLQQQDTYFVVAHIHYVLIGGAIFSIFASLFYWLPKMTGWVLSEKLGKLGFWVMLIGFNLAFFPFHILGLLGMPRRIYTYADNMGWSDWNLISTIGAFILGLGVLIFMINFVVSRRARVAAGADPWDGRTLEWSLPSPVPVYNFRTVPVVEGRDDFWLRKHPEAAPEHHEPGVAYAAGAAAGDAEGAGASGHGESAHGGAIHMPSPSYMPALLALGLTIAAFAARYRAWPLAIAGLVFTALTIYGWVLEDDSGYLLEPEGDA